MVNTFLECKTQATHIYFPLRHLEWLILFTASHKLHFRASSFRHDVCPCTINLSVAAPFGWILSFCAVEKRGSWIPSSLLIEFSHEMQTSFFTLVARICEHTHKESINLSTQLAASSRYYFFLRCVTAASSSTRPLIFNNLMCSCMQNTWSHSPSCITKLHSGVCCQQVHPSNACLHSSNLVNVCFWDCQQPIYSFLQAVNICDPSNSAFAFSWVWSTSWWRYRWFHPVT